MDALETVYYNNVPVRKLKTIKEDENDDIEIIKMVQRVVISYDDDDDKDDDDDGFFKQTLLHPRDRLKRSEKKYLQILPKKN